MPVRDLQIGQQGSSALTPPDLFMLNEASALTARFRSGTELPLTVPLDRVGNISVVGPREDCLRVARALLVQAAALHAPDDVAIALAVPGDRLADWEWAKWMPHLLDTEQLDGPVAARRIAPSTAQLARQIGPELRRRASYAAEVRRGLSGRDALSMTSRLLVVTDGHGEDAVELPRPDDAVGLRDMGVTVLHLLEQRIQEPGHVGVRITVDGDQVLIEDLREDEPVSAHGIVDEVGIPFAEGLARMLAPLRLSAESLIDAPLSGPVDFADLLGIDDVARLDLASLWAPRGERAFLRVPIGISDSREPVLLDLKESSELGMGPHGLCVGATGSGKSELLRTLVLALVATHPPEDLALVLVDYKGGATFAPFADLPHVAGVITNLENQAGLVERVHASLAGEVKRRQQVLKDAGNVADIGDYAALRADRRNSTWTRSRTSSSSSTSSVNSSPPSPTSSTCSCPSAGSAAPSACTCCCPASASRAASSRAWTPTSRTAWACAPSPPTSPARSWTPRTPSTFRRCPVSASSRSTPATTSGSRRATSPAPTGAPYSARKTRTPAPSPSSTRPSTPCPSPTARALRSPRPGAARPGRPRWASSSSSWRTPPTRCAASGCRRCPTRSAWTRSCGPLDVSARGMQLAKRRGRLMVPLGLLDDPTKQWQGEWYLDLTVAGGHAAFIGGPQSGKTTLLRTLVLSLALTHTPQEVGVYGLDLVGGGLQALSGLPHVGGIAGRADRERAARTVEEVRNMLATREDLFREHGIDSVEQLRTLHAVEAGCRSWPPRRSSSSSTASARCATTSRNSTTRSSTSSSAAAATASTSSRACSAGTTSA